MSSSSLPSSVDYGGQAEVRGKEEGRRTGEREEGRRGGGGRGRGEGRGGGVREREE